MKLSYVDLSGFRGYRDRIRFNFADGFTIIDGRNGVGKSTIFDAIEFSLTGTISKYRDAKADGESVADYLWWLGDGAPKDRFVEVGFVDGAEKFSVRRTQIGKPDAQNLDRIFDRLWDKKLAPEFPLRQLCSASIIRDEHIASLSLDLKEVDRYALLRDTLGANDADYWISRANELLTLTKRRTTAAQSQVTTANADLAIASRRIADVRTNFVPDPVLSAAGERLRKFVGRPFPLDRLAGPVRERIAVLSADVAELQALVERWEGISTDLANLPNLEDQLQIANGEREDAVQALAALSIDKGAVGSSALAAQARDMITLMNSRNENWVVGGSVSALRERPNTY